MTKSAANTAISVLTHQMQALESRIGSIQKEFEEKVGQRDALITSLAVVRAAADALPSTYDENELALMSMEHALHAIACADEHGEIDTADVVPTLLRTKHIPEDHESPARRLSGILGASGQFERVGPGKFRLVASAMPNSEKDPIGDYSETYDALGRPEDQEEDPEPDEASPDMTETLIVPVLQRISN